MSWRHLIGGTAAALVLLGACGDDSGDAVVKETVAPYEDSQSLAEWQEQTAELNSLMPNFVLYYRSSFRL